LKLCQKLHQNCTKTVPKTAPKLYQNCAKNCAKLCQNCAKIKFTNSKYKSTQPRHTNKKHKMDTSLNICWMDTLPAELIAEVVRWLDSPLDIGRLDQTSQRLFHVGYPHSAIEEGLRLRAGAAGRTIEAKLPTSETSWSQWLLWRERQLLARAPPVVSGCCHHSAFVDESGRLLTCGNAEPPNGNVRSGLLGHGDGVVMSEVPRVVAGLSGVRIRSVATGLGHTLVYSDEGTAYSFGEGHCGKLGHGDNAHQYRPRVIDALSGVRVVAVGAGYEHSFTLSETGELYSFGSNYKGALGQGFGANSSDVPRLVVGLTGVRICTMSVGDQHTLALNDAGDVYSFGYGCMGQLGHGYSGDLHTPQMIAALQEVRVANVAAASLHSYVVSTTGSVYSFGCGRRGRLGYDNFERQYTPRLINTLDGVRVLTVAAGDNHSLMLTDDKVYSFGGSTGICFPPSQLRGGVSRQSNNGELGHGDTKLLITPRVIDALSGLRVSSVAAGHKCSWAITAGGDVYGWGTSNSVVLGLELTTDQLVPLKYPPGLRARV
jgi:alpha-tubulin suppressor-like RCC1 family protein